MRVGFVRNAALGMVALVGLGLAGCDDNPTDFEADETVRIFANPTVMTVPAGVTTLLESRTENAGNEPTWEEITADVDGSCGAGEITVALADREPTIEPPGLFDVTALTTMGETCIQLEGGGVTETIEVTVVGDSVDITGAPAFLDLGSSVDLSAALLSDDGTPVSPFDEATDIVWTSDNEDAMTVDENGLVTAVGIGAAVITATWSGFGVSVSNSVSISSNQPELFIVEAGTDDPPPSSLLIFTSIDLDVNFVNPDDPPSDFGPFDQATDVTWTSSNPDAITIDASTGEATAVAAGTSTITVTWNVNEAVAASVDITVDVPLATLTSTDVASAEALDVVTITGTDFLPGLHTVLIDGALIDDFYAPTVVDATTATFVMPGGAAADLEVTVGIVGSESNALTVSRTCGALDDCPSEPDNDGVAGAPDLGALPVSFAGYVDGVDHTDLLELTLAAETTFDITLDWTGNSGDLDVVFTTTGATDYSEFECGFVTASAAQPEAGQCTLPAGTYFLWVESYDTELAFYQLDLVEVP